MNSLICAGVSKYAVPSSNRITTKLRLETMRLLRMVAAVTDEKQYDVVHRLLVAEWDRLSSQQDKAMPGL